jgi:hypothetical protein
MKLSTRKNHTDKTKNTRMTDSVKDFELPNELREQPTRRIPVSGFLNRYYPTGPKLSPSLYLCEPSTPYLSNQFVVRKTTHKSWVNREIALEFTFEEKTLGAIRLLGKRSLKIKRNFIQEFHEFGCRVRTKREMKDFESEAKSDCTGAARWKANWIFTDDLGGPDAEPDFAVLHICHGNVDLEGNGDCGQGSEGIDRK